MATDPTIVMLTGAEITAGMPFGENMTGPDLENGWMPGESTDYIAPVDLLNGVQGPPQNSPVQIRRDLRPLAADEIGQEGPFNLPWVRESQPVEGKSLPLNLGYGARFDRRLPGLDAELEPGGLQSPYPAVTQAQPPAAFDTVDGDQILFMTQEGAP